ncbi:response regulator [Salinispira pacifica]|uniref:Chemotaxis regulator-transmits chemoreceptor signals to flagelllar motor components CheY n=1 Tax=Salinispira pacifica TaxID=1307761 RepID=V5WHT9_9SPIO|nr:response regulator [Salinispira pacifica]AHC15099.1 Chemotaxis regulator - transmits chemoreceptor signals to flagelllar motor components CheY [Salinispira pacifica]
MKTALIVDDAAVMRMRLRDILEPKYHVIGEAENGEQAVELYKNHTPDFVTLDITMPRVDGIQVLEQLLSFDQKARVIIVSAVGQKKMVFNALGIGARDFIVKPFDPNRVMIAVDRLFGI